jgi:hypothetical protein
MRSPRVGVIMLVGMIGTAGCRSPMMAGADYDPSVVIGQPATFAWNEPDGLPAADPRLDTNPFFVERLHGAIARELGSRGIRRAVGQGRASLLVHHHASVQGRVEVFPAEQMGTMSPYGPGTQVVQWEEGNFLVDVMDAASGKIVWRGWARVDMGMLDEPEALDEVLTEAVARMFRFFPIPIGTPTPDEPIIEPVPRIGETPMPDVVRRPRPDPERGRR